LQIINDHSLLIEPPERATQALAARKKGYIVSETTETFTDGACSGNPGPGGWACIIRTGDEEEVLTGGDSATTNNRMEMQSAISALESLEGPCRIKLSDSQYLIKGMNEWIEGWKRNGWKNAKKPMLNPDLWKRLDTLAAEHQIEWIWLRGHDDHPENERVDKLAVKAVELYR
jgi:ribonuclease HI